LPQKTSKLQEYQIFFFETKIKSCLASCWSTSFFRASPSNHCLARSQGRSWAAIRLSHRPALSDHAVDRLDIGGQHDRRLVLLRHTGALIFPDFSWFMKLHTLGKNGATVCILIHRQLSARKSLLFTPVLTIRITRALPLRRKYHVSIARMQTCLQALRMFLVLTTQLALHGAVSADISSNYAKT